MKKTLIALALAAVAFGASAQQASVMQKETDSPTFGVKAQWNLNSPTTSYNEPVSVYTSGSGFSAGAFYTIPVYRGLYVEPEVSAFYNTVIIDSDILQALFTDQKVPPQGSLRNVGLRIPVNIGYRFNLTDDMALSLFTGPQLNVGLMLNRYVNATKRNIDLYDQGWRRIDAQWTFGARFYYADNWMAEITGGVGMTDLLGKSIPGHFHRNTFAVGVGYIF